MKLFNYVIEVRFHSRQPWSHFRVHRHRAGGCRWSGPVLYRHLVWGRLSVIFGQPHLETVRVCSECEGLIRVVSAGDESWDVCEDCRQVEGRTHEITIEEYEARS